ncbi:hypothetical protein, partial [Pseudomonas sp.]|uniref:hypothetical protein n=1 Tax=Pseudomonas sp. TaxID=306 RepID=UPI0035655567
MRSLSRAAPVRRHGLLSSNKIYLIDFIDYCRSGFSREFFVAQQSFEAEAAPTGTHKPTDTIAPRLLRDSAASGRRAISYQITHMSLIYGLFRLCRSGRAAFRFSREFFAAQQSFAAKAAPTTAGSLQFAARQRGVWTTGDLS